MEDHSSFEDKVLNS